MKKNKKNAGTALCVLLALLVAGGAFWVYRKSTPPLAKTDSVLTGVSSSFLEPTDIASIFYAEETGLFYEWNGSAFTEYPQEERTVQVTLSGETLTFSLHLIQKGGVYFGFGRARGAVVSYFVKAMNMPACPVGSRNFAGADILLLFDSSEKEMPQAQRLYGDAFAYRSSDGVIVREYLDDRLRIVTDLGVKRNDYFCFTTEMIQKSTPLRLHFLTRAKYELSDDPYRLYDLNSTEPSYYYAGYTADRLTLEDIILDYAYDTEGGIFHFKRGDGEFYAKIGSGTAEDQTICTFQGDYVTDYERIGDYLINTAQLRQGGACTVTNARTGEAYTFQTAHGYQELADVQMNSDRSLLAVNGTCEWRSLTETYTFQLLTLVDLATGTVTQYMNNNLYDPAKAELAFSGDTLFLYHDGQFCKVQQKENNL